MLRFAANISTMYGEVPFLARIAAAADAEFGAVECQWPYEHDAGDVQRCLQDAGMPMVLLNAPCGDRSAGEVGIAALPGREAEFRDTIDQAANYARQIGCKQIHVLAGIPAHESDHEACRALFVDNIRWAADRLTGDGVRVMVEPINRHDKPGYHLNGTEDAVSALRAIDRRNVGLQFDVYHSHRMAENVSDKLMKYAYMITHMQISGYPGRHEPHVGEIEYRDIFAQLSGMGYHGWIGCEYSPQTTTSEGLVWGREFGLGDKPAA